MTFIQKRSFLPEVQAKIQKQLDLLRDQQANDKKQMDDK